MNTDKAVSIVVMCIGLIFMTFIRMDFGIVVAFIGAIIAFPSFLKKLQQGRPSKAAKP